ncbi:MAG: type II toxin-antitoxin system MqsR family toxin [Lentilactobacillus diolivorans]|jgi:hypothetical protein|uniref:Uncharacterized protein n=2 Tax=Lentilactobacillus diolivorans TaxID=179838 RepID=A0A0R1SPG5_9LACO|nr:type II toxin-antitoxin system MqsR family toxin [Lentilactobacillus diolivorans]KRL68602.1 hypothetical protein FC85_GL002420 [Lentilactobacillus diolivorans DSM 14421]MCH4164319.1 type II toxin-antitoxin system MqsR family toxin [Lentilactobacillus diolivorans]RRG01329.1 MAG: hypothetical protein DUD34_12580 [Lactobacillus sp.]GEP23644.1 hypothetical protein LDI01_12370 [Lentilactobacillus diolivorans]
MVKASTQTITRFLIDFKKALSHGDWEIVERRADYAQMTEMPAKAIKIVLLGLTPKDYVRGPEADRNGSGEYVWVFLKNGVIERKLYIKLKLINGHAKVLSFHESLYD